MATGPDAAGRSRFAKLGMAINEVLTQTYRDILEKEVSPNHVYNSVRSSPIYSHIRSDQELLLRNARSSGYDDFDITLLYTLLRNICSKIPHPTKGWGGSTLPAAGDQTVGDDIERIRLIRNSVYGHSNSASISQAEFDKNWSLIDEVCRRLQSYCGKNYMKSLKNIETQCLEEEHEEAVIGKLKEECEKHKSIGDRLTSLEEAVKEATVSGRKGNRLQWFRIRIKANESSKQKDVDTYTEMIKDTLNSMIEAINKTSTEEDICDLQDSFEQYVQGVSCEDDKESTFHLLGKMKKKIHWFANIHPETQITVLKRFLNFLLELRRKYGVDSVHCKTGSVLLQLTFGTEVGYFRFLDDLKKGIVDQRLICIFVDLDLLSTVGLMREEISISITDIISEEDVAATEKTEAETTDIQLAPEKTEAETTDVQLAPEKTEAETTDIQLAPEKTEAETTDIQLAPEKTEAETTDIQLAPEKTEAETKTMETTPPVSMSSDTPSKEDVLGMDLNGLCEILEEMGVDYSSLEDLEEIRDLVLKSVDEQNASVSESRKSQASSEVMRRILERDAEVRNIVADLYSSLLDMLKMKQFEKNLGEEMTKEYNGYINTIQTYRTQLERRHCPIVVAGETGAGKSSLLNLIMGEHVLPRQVLSSTSTICQIFNSDTKRAEVIKKNGETIVLDDVTEVTLSKYVSVDRSGKSDERYTRVDVYWPLPMLQEYATIVDTPGIGESDEMTDLVLDFLTEAVAFIYVINTSNAGGVQKDRKSWVPRTVCCRSQLRLVRIFEEQKEFEKKGRLQQFDPESAIFVCNKWDQVPPNEERGVWEDITKKIKAHWPTRRDMDITRQMFKMSTTEDIRRSKAGLGYTEKFKSLLSGIDQLISASLERRVSRHVNWLQAFLDRLLVKVVARINATRKNQEEKDQMKNEVERRLRTLKEETEDVKMRMESAAELKCKHIAKNLTEHLISQETKNRMFRWHIDELPNDNDLDLIRYKAKQMILDKINCEVARWCQENDIAETSSQLFDLFMQECKLIKGSYTEIDLIIQGIQPPIADGNVPQAPETSSDFDATKSATIFPLQERIALVAFAPLWLPLVIGASVLALPVAVGMLIKDVIEEKRKIKNYRENKETYVLKWAEDELKAYNTDLVFSGLQQTYLRNFMSSITQVCDEIIPKQIEADEQLIENIVKENRDSRTVRQEYSPIEKRCKDIIGELLYAKMTHLSDCQPRILKEYEEIGSGSYSTVLSCDAEFGNRTIKCAVKKMTSNLHKDMYLQLTEVENLRKFQHQNIVFCYGVSIDRNQHGSSHLNVFMELCDCSLEDLILCYKHPIKLCKCNTDRRKTCHLFKESERKSQEFLDSWMFFLNMLKGVLNGLVFLHDSGFVHRDLKLTNVLVKDNIAKIADIGLSKPQNLLTGTIIGTPVAMAPEVFQGRIYDKSADIFSLAIMIWEMWYGRKVFSEEMYADVIKSVLNVK
ncbi:uncharacterized protein LOC125665478 isoform X3 [Ostrea edulis]|nr:uncharacterized protein LOC125665478 isoform X3 [Ostrea edulis]